MLFIKHNMKVSDEPADLPVVYTSHMSFFIADNSCLLIALSQHIKERNSREDVHACAAKLEASADEEERLYNGDYVPSCESPVGEEYPSRE